MARVTVREDPLGEQIEADWQTCRGTAYGMSKASFDLGFRMGWHAHKKAKRQRQANTKEHDDGTDDIS
jgi:hypothetical protein